MTRRRRRRARLPAPCNTPGCVTITADGHCDDHADNRRHRSAAWARLSAEIRAREPNCRTCGAPAEETDHIVPLRLGGALLDPANCQPLCRECHHAKTAAES